MITKYDKVLETIRVLLDNCLMEQYLPLEYTYKDGNIQYTDKSLREQQILYKLELARSLLFGRSLDNPIPYRLRCIIRSGIENNKAEETLIHIDELLSKGLFDEHSNFGQL